MELRSCERGRSQSIGTDDGENPVPEKPSPGCIESKSQKSQRMESVWGQYGNHSDQSGAYRRTRRGDHADPIRLYPFTHFTISIL